MISEKIDDI